MSMNSFPIFGILQQKLHCTVALIAHDDIALNDLIKVLRMAVFEAVPHNG
jgi:hypothetical protein